MFCYIRKKHYLCNVIKNQIKIKNMEQTIKWHYIAEEGLPKLKDNKPHSFLICDRVALAQTFDCGGQNLQVPTGEYL